MNGAALEHRGGGAGRGAGWRRGARLCAGLRASAAAGCCPPAAPARRGAVRAQRCGLSGRPAAAAACLQRAAGRALINALVNGKRCRARLLRAPGVPGSAAPGMGGQELAEGSVTCGLRRERDGTRCISLTGSCLGRNLPRYFNLERREICAGGLFCPYPPPSTLN